MGHDEELYEDAKAAATQADAVYLCPNHDDVLLTRDDRDAERRAYAFAAKRATEQAYDKEAMKKAVTSVLNDAGSECPYPPCNLDAE